MFRLFCALASVMLLCFVVGVIASAQVQEFCFRTLERFLVSIGHAGATARADAAKAQAAWDQRIAKRFGNTE